MADHGKNRRRSYYARKRQSEGKYKAEMHLKWRKKILQYWREFWSRPIEEVGKDQNIPPTR